MPCDHLVLKSGTLKQPKFISVEDVIAERNLDQISAKLLLPFHALTGCDTTSFLSGHSKKTSIRTFYEHKELLHGLGHGPLTDETRQNSEAFICKIYNVPNAATTDDARVILLKKAVRPELLPPTSDALKYHIERAHYQATVWLNATVQYPKLPMATSLGWHMVNNQMTPVLLSLSPVPTACTQLITCSCTTRCASQRCKCRKVKLLCTGSCKCVGDCMNDCH